MALDSKTIFAHFHLFTAPQIIPQNGSQMIGTTLAFSYLFAALILENTQKLTVLENTVIKVIGLNVVVGLNDWAFRHESMTCFQRWRRKKK